MESAVEPKEPAAEAAATPAAAPAPLPLPARILVRSSNWLGDAVMTVPAIRAIKRSEPSPHIAILTQAKLADFWKAVPEVDQIIGIGRHDSVFGVARKIGKGFDMALLLPNSIRSALEVWLARVPRRAGYPGKSRRWLLNEILAERPGTERPRHQVFHYLDLAKFAGAKIDDAALNPENFFPSTRTSKPAAGEKIKIGLCPGAEYGPAKRWLSDRFAAAANTVSQRRDCGWILYGTEKDKPVGEEITKQLTGNFTDLIGKTTLAELIASLRECRLLLTNDTGTMHLAAFLGVPTVSVFGSTEPILTGPLGRGHRILRHHVECSPCFLRECPIDFRCMRAVETEEVVEAALKTIDA